MAKKNSSYIFILIFLLVIATLLPVVINLFNKKDTTIDSNANPSVESFSIVDYSFNFEENADSINLVSGSIKTTKLVSNVFINIDGIGCQNLKYNVIKNSKDYYVIILEPNNGICNCSFATDFTAVAEIYVEYSGLNYLVSSQEIELVSAWGDLV